MRDHDYKSNLAAIGSRIRVLRVSHGMSQKALAREMGCTFQLIQKYEGGSIDLPFSKAMDLAKCLQTSPSKILFGEDDGTDDKDFEVSTIPPKIFWWSRKLHNLSNRNQEMIKRMIDTLENHRE